MCSILVLVIFLSSFHQVIHSISPQPGHCVMRNQCKGKFGPTPCVYNGPPKPLDTDVPIDDDMTSLQLLNKLCPEFVHDDDPHVCCTTKQLLAFQEQLGIAEAAGFARCPSCHHNFRQLICFMSCAPWQSRFLNVTKSQWFKTDDGTREVEVVEEIAYHVSELYAYSLYDSCKDLQGLIPGTLFMDFACGSWGSSKCSAENFLDFAGSTPEEGAYSPFKCKYIFHVANEVEVNGHTIYPMKEPHFKCSESPSPDLEVCSCYDCKESCSALSLTPPDIPTIPEPFHIFKRDGPTVVATLIFILFVITITLIFCCHKNPGYSTHQPFSVPASPSGVNLGSLEEIEPLRSKIPIPTSRTEHRRFSKKLTKIPSKFQMLGSWLENHLETQFMSWGLFVSRKPITIMVLSLFVCSVFSLGLFLNFDVTTNPVDLWVSPGSEARKDMEDYNKHFG
ncbi:NPC1-like intracellular cholesterol transporter 1 [Nephila pilipes]|uniref:NPC1-like intracellular cholesterol transporter 1 n=1 Tax=Nephila pilipes TaxID=299642 RepID=A0A8X6T8D8_NEPPI|nr:NPC1-like intracellular cholesterol transporter 1 [Nephila pilipes]